MKKTTYIVPIYLFAFCMKIDFLLFSSCMRVSVSICYNGEKKKKIEENKGFVWFIISQICNSCKSLVK